MPNKSKIVTNKNVTNKDATASDAFISLRKFRLETVRYAAYIMMFCIVVAFAISTSIRQPQFIKDMAAGVVVLVLFFFAERRFKLPLSVLFLAFVPMLLYVVGLSTGLYGVFLFDIGYDKYVHFISIFCITIISFYWSIDAAKDASWRKVVTAMMIGLGIGSINEINEFVGSRYLGVDDSGIFSQSDDLPTIRSDLQVYDSWWDMIFNFFGAIAAGIVLTISFWKHIHADITWARGS